jgi:branched-chain amino acid transport system permease protein
MEPVLQVAANGLIAGSTVAVLAVSYSLIYSILRFINFLFGEMLMLGAYSFFVLSVTIGFAPWVAAGLCVAGVGVAGTAVQLGAYAPLYRRSPLACLVTALGLSIVLQNTVLALFQGGPLVLQKGPAEAVLRAGGVAITYAQAEIFLCAIGLLIGVHRLVFKSEFGLRLRALADNLTVAELLGVRVDRTIGLVFFVGTCLAVLAGILLSLEHLLKPTMGASPGVQAFAACVVGGVGSVRGAVIAAFLISIASHFVSFLVPSIVPETMAYAALLAALVLFPTGLSAPLRAFVQRSDLYRAGATTRRLRRSKA